MNPATTPILHHYDGSPFSEKLRLILGYKNLAWASVKVPVIMPKPDVLALTGGYRKTPLLQVGADVYADTALAARVLEQLAPTPSLFPASAPLAPVLAQWADSTLFWTVIPYTMQPAGVAHLFAGVAPEVLKAFAADRAPFVAPMKRATAADATAALGGYLHALNAQLAAVEAGGRAFLLGADASVADFSVAHCLWYVKRGGPVAAIFEPHTHLLAWLARVLAFGHGQPQPMTSTQALAAAAEAASHNRYAPTAADAGQGFEAGQPATVTPTDYGMDSTAGTLVGLDAHEVVLRRTDPRAGTVHVHFPRAGYQVKAD
jgi:glutathione S-transferase